MVRLVAWHSTVRLFGTLTNYDCTWRRHSHVSPSCRTDASSGPPPLNSLTFRPVVGQLSTVAGANSLPSDVTSASSQPVFKNRLLKTYLFRRCYETVWLWLTFLFPSHYPPLQNSGPCNSFHCLGHFKNVHDDDDDCELLCLRVAMSLLLPGA